MPSTILVATPQHAFGELLRDSLQAQPGYSVVLASTATEALDLACSKRPALAVLDSALDTDFSAFFASFQSSSPGTGTIVVPPDNNPAHPALRGLQPGGYLNQPFYLPDLIELAARLLYEAETQQQRTDDPAVMLPPAWQDRAVLTDLAAQALRGSKAMAALVGIYGADARQGKLHLFTGSISYAAALEVARVTFLYWNANEKTDLMRFLQPAADQQDLLVYATHLAEHLVLVFVYEANVPLSAIRPEIRRAHQVFRTATHGSTSQPAAPSQASEKEPAERAKPQEAAQNPAPPARRSAVNEPITEPLKQPEPDRQLRPSFLSFLPEEPVEENSLEAEPIDLAALLGTIPNPDAPTENTFPRPDPFYAWQIGDPAPEVQAPPAAAKPAQPVYVSGENLPAAPAATTVQDPPVDPLEDTRPHVVAALTNLGQLEPVSPALSMLNYTCVLVPRFPQHFLTGELAEQLGQWVQQLCLAYGWRLEGISIRPDYLQWSVQVAPSISPGNLVRIVRQRTSLNLYQKYAQLTDQNPSGDFWATGYLIVSGAQPPSAQLLREYISQTRKRQGISR